MIGRRLGLLNTRDVIAWRIDAKIYCFRVHHPSTIVTAQSYCQQTLLPGLFKGYQHIRRVAARRDAQGNVTSPSISNNLASKNIVEADIVPYSRYYRNVVGQRNRRQRRPGGKRRVEQFGYQVLGISSASPVAKGQQGSARGKGLCHGSACRNNPFSRMFERRTAQFYHLTALFECRMTHLRQYILYAGLTPLEKERIKQPVVL